MHKTLAAAAGFGLLIATTAALAQPMDFTTADSDKNGTVSLTELQTLFPNATDADFQSADIDDSGELSQEEYEAYAAASSAGSGSDTGDDDVDEEDQGEDLDQTTTESLSSAN